MTEVTLNICKARISSTKCCAKFCNVQHPAKLYRVCQELRYEIMKSKRYYIPQNARACELHSDFVGWPETLNQNEQCKFNISQIEEMVDLLRYTPKHSKKFVLREKSDFDFRTDTGLTRAQFTDLFQRLQTISSEFKYNKNNETATESLYMYLMKLRTGRTNDDIGLVFGITRCTVTERMNKIRKILESDFVFQNVNFEMSRGDLAQRTSLLSQMLFCGGDNTRPVLVLDGTYVFIQSSSNYEFQKKSYNGHKKRNFVRVMVCTTTDGTIAFVLGPYPASTNDASIMSSLVNNSNAFKHLVQGDVILLDRGFRDCVDEVEKKGFVVKMPHLIQKSATNKQFSTLQANETRLVTANRYGVETRNGHFKTIFKIFAKVWPNNTLPIMMTDFRIAAALINVYFKSIESHKGHSDEIATKMMNRLHVPNLLSTIVDRRAFQNKLREFNQFYDFDTLPQLSVKHLIQIALGTYQIRQAPSYCQLHFRTNNSEFVVYECPDDVVDEFLATFNTKEKELKLLMARMKSRFRSQKSHDVYILIDMIGEGEQCILEYCCSCQNGLRTVGTCSHVMSLIWFSLYIKNAYAMPQPAAFLNDYFIEEYSSDDNDDDEE